MRRGLFILLCSFLIIGQSTAQKKDITLEDVWQYYAFFPASVSGFNFMNDGKHYAKIDDDRNAKGIFEYDITTGEKSGTIFSGAEAKLSSFSSYRFSENEDKILLETEKEQIYRHSSRANFFVWNKENKSLNPLSENGKQRYARFNKSADRVAFVRKNNLFYKDLNSGKEIQITNDGKENEIINGATDWVYEEEFSIPTAFEWSPDGNRIAFLKFDESNVEEFTMTMYTGELYPGSSTFKYPKAGEDNAKVSLHIYTLKSGKTQKIDLGNQPDMYIPRIKWTKDPNQLIAFHMNRHQNELELISVNAKNGKTQSILKEKNKYYIDIHDHLTFLEDGKRFVWTSEKSGYNHIYIYDFKGQKTQITKGNFDVTAFYGVDEKKGLVYFQSAEVSPMERHVYSINLKGKKKKQLTTQSGTNRAQFSSTKDYYVNTHSAANVPPSTIVYSATGKQVRTIEDNAAFKKRVDAYNTSPVEFFDFKTSENVSLNGWMIKPPNMEKGKKYPVFMYVYGGPGSQTAQDSWNFSNYGWFQMLAQKGYIVVSVDNRGTGARGEEFKKMTYLQLGKYETIDQIETAKYLASQSYVDGDRIGIFGWSYGGYLSSLCLLKGADVFKAAIAVAPVTNWKWYDTIYTERFMQTPKENERGYEDNSPTNFANLLEGEYLIVHGTADDNVHAQNTYEMINALINANKQFDSYFYPNRNHGIYGGVTRLHLYTKMTNFILENL